MRWKRVGWLILWIFPVSAQTITDSFPTPIDVEKYQYRLENETVYNPLKPQTFEFEDFYQMGATQSDGFGTLAPSNLGRTWTPLTIETRKSLMTHVPTGKQHGYRIIDSMRWYNVPTPTTRFEYLSGYKKGQQLNTLFTHSPKQYWNYHIDYKNLYSQGHYQNQISDNTRLIIGVNGRAIKNRYQFETHYGSFRVDNAENGGIASIDAFENSKNASERYRLTVNMLNATSEYRSQRWGLNHRYRILNASKWHIHHGVLWESSSYQYLESTPQNFIESTYRTPIPGAQVINSWNQDLGLKYIDSSRWEVGASLTWKEWSMGHQQEETFNNIDFPNTLNETLWGGKAYIKNHHWTVDAQIQKGQWMPTLGDIKTQWKLESPIFKTFLEAYYQKRYPDLNHVFHQSRFTDYNYLNTNFEAIEDWGINGLIIFKPTQTQIKIHQRQLQHYVYIDSSGQPTQLNESLPYWSIEWNQQIQYLKPFYIQWKGMYQSIEKNAEYLPLPHWLVRAAAYYQHGIFKQKAQLQLGIGVHWFEGFKARRFSPVLNDWMLQSDSSPQTIGNQAYLDMFINLEVQRMQFYIKGQHINSFIGTPNFWAAPNEPYLDANIVFGIKWYLFT